MRKVLEIWEKINIPVTNAQGERGCFKIFLINLSVQIAEMQYVYICFSLPGRFLYFL